MSGIVYKDGWPTGPASAGPSNVISAIMRRRKVVVSASGGANPGKGLGSRNSDRNSARNGRGNDSGKGKPDNQGKPSKV